MIENHQRSIFLKLGTYLQSLESTMVLDDRVQWMTVYVKWIPKLSVNNIMEKMCKAQKQRFKMGNSENGGYLPIRRNPMILYIICCSVRDGHSEDF